LRNAADGNDSGFVLYNAAHTELRRNVANRNVRYGFYAFGEDSVGSVIVRNAAHDNNPDARDLTPPGATTWLCNDFGTTQDITSPVCDRGR
jgi:hypothetical protein